MAEVGIYTGCTGNFVHATHGENVLWQGTDQGVTWTGKIYVESIEGQDTVFVAWKFEWDELAPGGVRGVSSTINATWRVVKVYKQPRNSYTQKNCSIKVDAKCSGVWVESKIGELSDEKEPGDPIGEFECSVSLTARMDENCHAIHDNFKPTEKTDAILVVEEQKLHVNKAFLSYHSEFFDKLFSSDFKEKSMAEIPIGDVKFDDFARLLSIIQPNSYYVTDKDAPKLLELAGRFMMPAVTNHVEVYLVGSQMENMQKIQLADQYDLQKLLQAVVKSLGTKRQAQDIARDTDYSKLSDTTKVKILHHLLSFL